MESEETISMHDCVTRGVYQVTSRNLSVAVYDGSQGFIGIREKFGNRYLFTEYHWDSGAPFGTVRPHHLIATLPDQIALREHEKPVCSSCKAEMTFDRDSTGLHGTWFHADSGTAKCLDGIPTSHVYQPLFAYLTDIEENCNA
jgi:hypothetical protein